LELAHLILANIRNVAICTWKEKYPDREKAIGNFWPQMAEGSVGLEQYQTTTKTRGRL
jgi:hypothetical protein